MLNLLTRAYQADAVRRTLEAIRGGATSGLWVMPTGTGKTRTASELIRALKVPTLFLVHRDELIRQTVATLGQMWPACRCSVVRGSENDWSGDVVIASVQSLREQRIKQVPPERFGLLIADEAHHAPAPSWVAVLEYFEPGYLLGVTATPDRLDGKGLADLFGPEPVYSYSLLQAVRDKYLVGIRQYAVRTDVSLDGVATRGGDFAEGELAGTVDTEARNKAIVEAYLEHGQGRRAVAFCVTVEHANNLADAFDRAGVRATSVHGSLKRMERRILLEGFEEGEFRVVCNCNILTEGYDDPGISCVLMCRPTKSRALYTQAVGRGLRLAPGKEDCLIFDVVDNCKRHKLVKATSLLGVQEDDLEGGDVLEALDEQEREEEARQQEFRLETRGIVSWRLESVCPWPGLPSLEGWVDHLPWHCKPASERQMATLKRMGLAVHYELTCGEASCLLDQAFSLEAAYPAPATAKQEWCLRHHGLWVEGMTKREAGRIIGELKRVQQDETDRV